VDPAGIEPVKQECWVPSEYQLRAHKGLLTRFMKEWNEKNSNENRHDTHNTKDYNYNENEVGPGSDPDPTFEVISILLGIIVILIPNSV